MKSLDDLLAGFREEAEEDYIGLWAVVWTVRDARQESGLEEIRALSMGLIGMMLDNGFVAGDLSKDGFVPWPDRRAEVVLRRIEREWDALGREPTIGEIAWFGLPPAY